MPAHDSSIHAFEPNEQSNEILKQQQAILDIMQAPKAELSVFDGNPLKYYPFIRAFEDNVDKVVKDSGSKLARLVHYTSGKANKVLQGCLLMQDSTEGYQRARSLLEERFGNKFVISNAWIEKVTSEGYIKPKDSTGLQELADDLRICYDTLTALGSINEVNTQATLVKIINKLPSFLHARWKKQVARLQHEEFRLPSLADVVYFVEIAAGEANHPIYGHLGSSSKQLDHTIGSKSSHLSSNKQRGGSSFATSAASSHERTCKICGQRHSLFDCTQMKDMSVDQRIECIKRKRLCFNCLKGNHSATNCKSTFSCKRCHKRHHTLLHRERWNANESAQPQPQQDSAASTTKATSSFISHASRTALPILAVKVKAPGSHKSLSTYALLDSGSTASVVSDKVLNKLGIVGKPQQATLTTLEGQGRPFFTKTTSLEVTDLYDNQTIHLPVIMSRPHLPIDIENLPTYEDIRKWPHLHGIELAQADCDIGLLIGQDVPEALIPLDVIRGKRGEPYAVRSALGWTVNGPLGVNTTQNHGRSVSSNFVSAKTADQSLNEQLEAFWKIESNGVYGEETAMSVKDQEVIKLWDDTTEFKDGHYHLKIPFKDTIPRLPDSLPMAISRLESLRRKLNKNERLKTQYVQEMEELFDKGFAEKIRDKELDREDRKIWYLPHHPVTNPNKEKIRIVFDSSAKSHGKSLNSELNQGPDLINKLAGILIRFRQEAVAFMADIKTMFYQCKVAKEDQDVFRFLWWENGDMSQAPQHCRMKVHVFGAKSSPACCCYSVRRTTNEFGASYSQQAKDIIVKNMYVDDLITSVKGTDEARALSVEIKNLLSEGGFHLTKWCSNKEGCNCRYCIQGPCQYEC